jgi:hypothetical protein
VLETTLAKEMQLNTIGALYRPYNIFSDIQENIDGHSQPTLEENIKVCTNLPSSLPYQQIPSHALTLSLVTFAHAQNSFTTIPVHTICVLDELLHPHIDALRALLEQTNQQTDSESGFKCFISWFLVTIADTEATSQQNINHRCDSVFHEKVTS